MKEVLKQVDEAFAFMHRTEPEVMHAFAKSLEASEKPGSPTTKIKKLIAIAFSVYAEC